jgi:hypothetical protein
MASAESMCFVQLALQGIWAMDKKDEWSEGKLADRELVAFANQVDDNNTLSVLIEVATNAQVQLEESRVDGNSRRSAVAMPSDETAERQRMDQLEEKLIRQLKEKPVRLDAAQAFVADLTPQQLRAVSSWNEVGYVRPNRTHRLSE